MPRVLSDSAQAILDLQPVALQSTSMFRAIAAAQAEQFDALDASLLILEQTFFPMVAVEHLDLWETMLNLPSAGTLVQRRTAVLAFLSRAVASGSGLDWVATATRLLGTGWSYRTYQTSGGDGLTPPVHVINVFIAYDPDAISATTAELLLNSITPANTSINVSYSEGFILDVSTFGDLLS